MVKKIGQMPQELYKKKIGQMLQKLYKQKSDKCLRHFTKPTSNAARISASLGPHIILGVCEIHIKGKVIPLQA